MLKLTIIRDLKMLQWAPGNIQKGELCKLVAPLSPHLTQTSDPSYCTQLPFLSTREI